MNYTIHCEESEGPDETGYVIFIDELPGAISQGESLTECLTNLADAVNLLTKQSDD